MIQSRSSSSSQYQLSPNPGAKVSVQLPTRDPKRKFGVIHHLHHSNPAGPGGTSSQIYSPSPDLSGLSPRETLMFFQQQQRKSLSMYGRGMSMDQAADSGTEGSGRRSVQLESIDESRRGEQDISLQLHVFKLNKMSFPFVNPRTWYVKHPQLKSTYHYIVNHYVEKRNSSHTLRGCKKHAPTNLRGDIHPLIWIFSAFATPPPPSSVDAHCLQPASARAVFTQYTGLKEMKLTSQFGLFAFIRVLLIGFAWLGHWEATSNWIYAILCKCYITYHQQLKEWFSISANIETSQGFHFYD